MIVSTLTPGKLILLGEYAVLEGASAVVQAINKFAKISIQKSMDNQFYITAPNLLIENVPFNIDEKNSIVFNKRLTDFENDQLKLFKNIFEYIYTFFINENKSLEPCSISIDSSDFYFKDSKYKLGLGSSAALTVGLFKSLYEFNQMQFENNQKLFHSAMNAHFEAQNKIGSGIDIAASAFGGVGLYKKIHFDYSYKNIELPQDLKLIPIWTGASTSTSEFVAKIKELKKSKTVKYNQIMEELIEASNEGCQSLSNGNSLNFLIIVNRFFELLNNLGSSAGISIISNSHRKIASIVRECKGYYKPSGAGGSDIGIAFTDNEQIKNDIVNAINESDFEYIKLETAF